MLLQICYYFAQWCSRTYTERCLCNTHRPYMHCARNTRYISHTLFCFDDIHCSLEASAFRPSNEKIFVQIIVFPLASEKIASIYKITTKQIICFGRKILTSSKSHMHTNQTQISSFDFSSNAMQIEEFILFPSLMKLAIKRMPPNNNWPTY